MSDLIKRLRDPALMKRWWDQYGWEAADEIERLQAEVDRLGTAKNELFADCLRLAHELARRTTNRQVRDIAMQYIEDDE